MDDPKPYEFIGLGAMDGPKPYEFIRFGAMDDPKPYEFIWFGAMDDPNTKRNRPQIVRVGLADVKTQPYHNLEISPRLIGDDSRGRK